MKKALGQYFTKNIVLQKTIFEFIQNNPTKILEPCIGQGHLVSYILQKNNKIDFDMFEIDTSLELLPTIDIDKSKVQYADFLEKNIVENYDTIVGNPPYVRTKGGNLYIDFTKKCFTLLNPGGELIFIVPSDFFKLTSSSNLLIEMMTSGTFTHIYHPHNEKLFESASIDVIVFRYCKDSSLTNETIYNGVKMYLQHKNGLITFSEKEHLQKIKKQTFSDLFTISVGLVSGREDVYKNENFGNIAVLNGENHVEKYIFVQTFPSENAEINEHLLRNKSILLSRAIRKFTEKNWFEWGAPRNITLMQKYKGRPCIFIYTLTRQETIAFLGKVQYFGGGLIMLLPKNPMTDEKMMEVVTYLNSNVFKHNFIFSGRFKIGQRQLCNSNYTL